MKSNEYNNNEFVGPGKVFETEEEEFAEYIEMMEWATQASPEELARFQAAVTEELSRRGNRDGQGIDCS